jgi:hypothetical protein
MPQSDIEQTAIKSREMIHKIAERRGITPAEAATETPEGRHILELTEKLADIPPGPVEDTEVPAYLEAAAREIAASDGISTEQALGRVAKRYPDLAERYRLENI